LAFATDQLLVAIALAPPAATALALPASQMLKRTSGFPGMCNARNCSALNARSAILLRRLSGSLPVCAQFFVELFPAFLGEEDSGANKLDTPPGAGNIFGQPMRPFHVEIHIICCPDNECRCLQRLQPSFNSERVLVVEGREESLEITGVLFGCDQRTQIFFNAVVAHLFCV